MRGQELLQEFEQEMATTRRLLERVPSDKPDWKPHPKSFSVAHLAQLVARMPGWVAMSIERGELDLSGASAYTNEKTEVLLAEFDRNVQKSREALGKATDADFELPWSLSHQGKVLFTSTRGAIVRQSINHLVHHRGQLTVYLRMLDVPIPSIYGPTADERTW